jgi:hypothetical protein
MLAVPASSRLLWLDRLGHGGVAEKVGRMMSKEAAHEHTVEGQCNPSKDNDTIGRLAQKYTQEYGEDRKKVNKERGLLVYVKDQNTPVVREVKHSRLHNATWKLLPSAKNNIVHE